MLGQMRLPVVLGLPSEDGEPYFNVQAKKPKSCRLAWQGSRRMPKPSRSMVRKKPLLTAMILRGPRLF